MQNKLDLQEIDKKNKIIDNTIIRLKKEFIGIDEQIDQVMNHIRTWYLYPQLQTSPVVVCLWGLTGIGKTSLLKKIAKYLDIESDLVYFNFAEINEMTSYEVESNIEEQLANEKPNRMFVYDEFQYAATLDAHGAEKDNKNGLKPFWELLDTGIIRKRIEYWSIRYMTRTLSCICKINEITPMHIVDGEWVNAQECLAPFNRWEVEQFAELLNFDEHTESDYDNSTPPSEIDVPNTSSHKLISCNKHKEFFVKGFVMEKIIDFACKTEVGYVDKMELYNRLTHMSLEKFVDYLVGLTKRISKGYDLTFNESIIFIVGNLDEAYDIAFDVCPDMSPDQFNDITKKISVVEIKQSLQKRFRNEQIARMGNCHIAYPSFSSESFRKIIALHLEEYKELVKNVSGFNIEFDNPLKKMLYNESVYPTHGTRPVFSTIQELVKTKLPIIVQTIYDKGINIDDVSKFVYSYRNKTIVIDVMNDKDATLDTIEIPVSLKLDKLRKSTKDDTQALTALHESGHFVIYAKCFGKLPERLIVKTADPKANGFMLEENSEKQSSKQKLYNDICVLLGGYVAEKIVFGEDNLSAGASSDLVSATRIASNMVRCLGMGNMNFVSTHNRNSMEHILCVVEEDQRYITDQIKEIMTYCERRVKEILSQPEWFGMLKESAQWLADHSEMSKKKMQSIYNNVSDSVKTVANDSFYRDTVFAMGQK